MNVRTDLIERAAARLRAREDPQIAASSAATAPALDEYQTSARSAVKLPTPPLRRHVTLDRAQLAKQGILMPWTTTARVVEEFRIIKRNIMAALQASESRETGEMQARVVMVTSARPREGKTFSAVNLALAFAAEENLTTILIDADSVRGDASRILQMPSEPGLIEVLSGKSPLSDVLIQSDLENLVVLPPGAPGPHVPELLASAAPQKLMSTIADCYRNHVIVMDTPPCLASTDPTALVAVARQVVFVVEAAHTQQAEIESALSLIGACPNINFMLNLVPTGASDHFGAYSYHYEPPKTQPQ